MSFAKDTSAACIGRSCCKGRARHPEFLYLFMDTFVGGGLVINSHLHRGLHGNAGAVASLPCHPPSRGRRLRSSSARHPCGSWSSWLSRTRPRPHGRLRQARAAGTVAGTQPGLDSPMRGFGALHRFWPLRFWILDAVVVDGAAAPAAAGLVRRRAPVAGRLQLGRPAPATAPGAGQHRLRRPGPGRSAVAAARLLCARP